MHMNALRNRFSDVVVAHYIKPKSESTLVYGTKRLCIAIRYNTVEIVKEAKISGTKLNSIAKDDIYI